MWICSAIFQANAKIAAAQENLVDCMMNATGMLILNELDNISFKFVKQFMTHDEVKELKKNYGHKVNRKDNVFSFWYSVLLLIFMVYYSFWFLIQDGRIN